MRILGILFFAALPAFAQPLDTRYTRPIEPSGYHLDRANLKLAWRMALPVNGRREGVAWVQPIDDSIYVQLTSNLIVSLKAATGEQNWTFQPPRKFEPSYPVVVSDSAVFVVNGPFLLMLERRSGRQLLSMELSSTVAEAPLADRDYVYLTLSNDQMIAIAHQPEDVIRGEKRRKIFGVIEPPSPIRIGPQSSEPLATSRNTSPSVGLLHSLQSPFAREGKDVTPSLASLPIVSRPYTIAFPNRTPSIGAAQGSVARLTQESDTDTTDRLRIEWTLRMNRRLISAPLLFADYIVYPGADRTIAASKREALKGNDFFEEFRVDTPISARPAQYANEFYVPLEDGNLYAYSAENFRNPDVPMRINARFLAAGGIDRRPLVSDDSVYVAGSDIGLYRLDRKTLTGIWRNTEIERVLSVNAKFTYARDRRGNLLVLDKARGVTLTRLEMSEFTVPITNEQDDRLYFAAHDGTLICMHDRGYPFPVKTKLAEPKPSAPLPPVTTPKKDVMPKDMMPKDAMPAEKKDP